MAWQNTILPWLLCFSVSWCAPVNLGNEVGEVSQTSAFLLSGLVVVAVLVVLVLAIVGCTCCQNQGFKSFTERNGIQLPQRGTSVGTFEGLHADSEFTIFPPASAKFPSPIANGESEPVTFEPLPDIRPRNSVPYERPLTGSLLPRPAYFKASVTRGLSLHDWFSPPYGGNFPRSRLQYLQEVGVGWYGQAVEGEAQQILPDQNKSKVVVKILRQDASPSEHMYFLHEVRQFRDLSHTNILRLLGQCLETDPFLVLLEHCQINLKSYLISQRSTSEELLQRGLLLEMTCQLTSGLLHMHSKGFIHTDLAARNCLLDHNKHLKIGDYGTSYSSFPEDYYCHSEIAIPLRWSAPETLLCTEKSVETKEVTEEANIWSFGVMLWEMMELGKQPYMELSDDQVLQQVVGLQQTKLEEPKTACLHRALLYQIMQQCWSPPESRPSMSKIQALLGHLQQNKEMPPSQAFEERWHTLQHQPYTPRQHNLQFMIAAPDSPPLVFESHFNPRSASLQNLRGSLEDIVLRQELEEEEDKVAHQITLAIQELDDYLASEVPSSDVSSDTATPDRKYEEEWSREVESDKDSAILCNSLPNSDAAKEDCAVEDPKKQGLLEYVSRRDVSSPPSPPPSPSMRCGDFGCFSSRTNSGADHVASFGLAHTLTLLDTPPITPDAFSSCASPCNSRCILPPCTDGGTGMEDHAYTDSFQRHGMTSGDEVASCVQADTLVTDERGPFDAKRSGEFDTGKPELFETIRSCETLESKQSLEGVTLEGGMLKQNQSFESETLEPNQSSNHEGGVSSGTVVHCLVVEESNPQRTELPIEEELIQGLCTSDKTIGPEDDVESNLFCIGKGEKEPDRTVTSDLSCEVLKGEDEKIKFLETKEEVEKVNVVMNFMENRCSDVDFVVQKNILPDDVSPSDFINSDVMFKDTFAKPVEHPFNDIIGLDYLKCPEKEIISSPNTYIYSDDNARNTGNGKVEEYCLKHNLCLDNNHLGRNCGCEINSILLDFIPEGDGLTDVQSIAPDSNGSNILVDNLKDECMDSAVVNNAVYLTTLNRIVAEMVEDLLISCIHDACNFGVDYNHSLVREDSITGSCEASPYSVKSEDSFKDLSEVSPCNSQHSTQDSDSCDDLFKFNNVQNLLAVCAPEDVCQIVEQTGSSNSFSRDWQAELLASLANKVVHRTSPCTHSVDTDDLPDESNCTNDDSQYEVDDILAVLEHDEIVLEKDYSPLSDGSGRKSAEDCTLFLEDLETGNRDPIRCCSSPQDMLDDELLIVDVETNEAMMLDPVLRTIHDQPIYNDYLQLDCYHSSRLESILEESDDASHTYDDPSSHFFQPSPGNVVHSIPPELVFEGDEVMAGDCNETDDDDDDSSFDSEEIEEDLDSNVDENEEGHEADEEFHFKVASPFEHAEMRPEDAYTPDFESDTDDTSSSTGTSCTSSSGSFECPKAPLQSPVRIFSTTWDSTITPTKSAIRSPEKIKNPSQEETTGPSTAVVVVGELKKSVSFHEEDPMVVFSYPPAESDDDSEDNEEVPAEEFTFQIDYMNCEDWEFGQCLNGEIAEEDFEDGTEEDTSELHPRCSTAHGKCPPVDLSTMMYSLCCQDMMDSLDSQGSLPSNSDPLESMSNFLSPIKRTNVDIDSAVTEVETTESCSQFLDPVHTSQDQFQLFNLSNHYAHESSPNMLQEAMLEDFLLGRLERDVLNACWSNTFGPVVPNRNGVTIHELAPDDGKLQEAQSEDASKFHEFNRASFPLKQDIFKVEVPPRQELIGDVADIAFGLSEVEEIPCLEKPTNYLHDLNIPDLVTSVTNIGGVPEPMPLWYYPRTEDSLNLVNELAEPLSLIYEHSDGPRTDNSSVHEMSEGPRTGVYEASEGPRIDDSSVYELCEGPQTDVSSVNEVSEGLRTDVLSVYEVSEGHGTKVSSFYELSEGPRTEVSSVYEVSEGPRTEPSAVYEVSEDPRTEVSSVYEVPEEQVDPSGVKFEFRKEERPAFWPSKMDIVQNEHSESPGTDVSSEVPEEQLEPSGVNTESHEDERPAFWPAKMAIVQDGSENRVDSVSAVSQEACSMAVTDKAVEAVSKEQSSPAISPEKEAIQEVPLVLPSLQQNRCADDILEAVNPSLVVQGYWAT